LLILPLQVIHGAVWIFLLDSTFLCYIWG
jgi:hypothetical protein